MYSASFLPTQEITPIMEKRIVNNLPLELKAMPQEDWQYALAPPPYLLILPEDSVKSFFEGSQIDNNVTSFLSKAYDATTRTYLRYPISRQFTKISDGE